MILFVDLLNTIIQSFIVSYFPYYLSFNNLNCQFKSDKLLMNH